MRQLFLPLLLLLAWTAAAQTNPVNGNISAQSTDCSTASSCVSLQLNQNAGAAIVTVTGTYSGTLQFEVSNGNGSNYASASATPVAGGAAVTSTTSTGSWRINVSGATNVRVRCSSYSSGTAAITISFGSGSASSGSGSGTVNANNSSNAHALTVYNAASGSTTVQADTGAYTDGAGNLVANTVGTGTAPAIGTGTGGFGCTEASSTGWTAGVGIDYFRCDSTAHALKFSFNNGAEGALNVASGGTGAATLTGPIKGNGTSAMTAAAAADIVGLFSTCSGTQYLGADGACHTSSGGASVLMGGDSQGFVASPQFLSWIPIGGGLGAGNGQSICTPISHAGTIKNLYVSTAANLAAASSATFTAYKLTAPSTDTSLGLTCTISAGSASCNDTTHTAALSAGDCIYMGQTYTGTPGTNTKRWSADLQ